MNASVFARITKVDEETRTVTGRAAQETVDRDGEIFDYASSKPNFQAWSAEVFADTDGKSHGNVRAMHGNVAAGILTNLDFDDVEKAIDVVATITDDVEWKKVTTGTYSGFSIGGRYARKWAEPVNGKIVQRYEAVPSEISLVDRPCIPTAKFFTVHKRDGRKVKRAFVNQEVDTMQMSDEMAKYLKIDVSRSAIRKIHAAGPRPMPANFIHKFTGWAGTPDRATVEIRKSQRSPLALHPTANVRIDTDQLAKMLKRGRRMRKLAFPPQSDNATWTDPNSADTGATGSFADEGTQRPNNTLIPRVMPMSVSNSPNIAAAVNSYGVNWQTTMDAATKAIKQDLKRPQKWSIG